MTRTSLLGLSVLALSLLDGCGSSALTPSGTGGTAGSSVGSAGAGGADAGSPLPACEGTPVRVQASLSYPPTNSPSSVPILPPLDLQGTVTGVARDSTTAAIRITIRDANNADWVLSIVAPASWEASAKEIVGRPVTLKARYARRFQLDVSFGFVLNDADGLVMAAETGRWQNTLNADTPLPIRHGAPLCVDECGATMTELIFTGTTDVTVGPSADRELTIGTRKYLAHNSGALTLPTFYSCDEGDVATEKWAVWRQPLP
jgi:hypothetical protein